MDYNYFLTKSYNRLNSPLEIHFHGYIGHERRLSFFCLYSPLNLTDSHETLVRKDYLEDPVWKKWFASTKGCFPHPVSSLNNRLYYDFSTSPTKIGI